MITTTKGPMDESTLLRKDTVVDNDNEHTECVEYCLPDCAGNAHRTQTADSSTHFCNDHIHRSVHVKPKKLPEGFPQELT